MSIYNKISHKDFSGKASLEVISKDRNGLVGDITTQAAVLGITILNHKAITFTDEKSRSMSKLVMTVKTDEFTSLESLMHKINRVNGVISVLTSPV